MLFRNLKRVSAATGLGALLVALHFISSGSALAQFGSVSITTDQSQYIPGSSMKVCYTVAGPGLFTITDMQANGSSHVFFTGIDDGTGGCLGGTVTPPAGTECLSIVAQGGGGGSAQTCFQVGNGVPPPPPPPPPTHDCGTVSALNGHVSPSVAQQVEDCFYQGYQQCSAATMLYTDAQNDSGTKYSFELKQSGGACTIVEGVQHYTLPTPPGPPKLGSCASVKETALGLRFISCQGGADLLVPDINV